MRAERPRVVRLGNLRDRRGDLTVIAPGGPAPFRVRRVYCLRNVPPGRVRGGHAFRRNRQMLVALAGRFRVTLDNGRRRTSRWLSRPDRALYVPPMTWLTLDRFSSGAVCLALASTLYDPADYHRDRRKFLSAARRRARR